MNRKSCRGCGKYNLCIKYGIDVTAPLRRGENLDCYIEKGMNEIKTKTIHVFKGVNITK
jgi:hypothetical protein